ncbi:MAG: hypothetical protein P1U58_17065 [Verrucomicrobiales bacterium]|nr:hypothetical protein [Verrucomicrobiales bacterium]
MPHEEVIEGVKNAAVAKGLPESAADRILAWLNEAESGSFAAKERREQLHKILEVMHGYDTRAQEEA